MKSEGDQRKKIPKYGDLKSEAQISDLFLNALRLREAELEAGKLNERIKQATLNLIELFPWAKSGNHQAIFFGNSLGASFHIFRTTHSASRYWPGHLWHMH
jgi:hypothetical protein